jgi:hypothetical protein
MPRCVFLSPLRIDQDVPPLRYLLLLFILDQQNDNIMIVNAESFTTFLIFAGSIPDLIKSFGVNLVSWIQGQLKENDVNLSLFFFLGA